MEWTPRQVEAWALLTDPANTDIMLYGGARSGKTYLFLAAIVLRALEHPGSRHLVARLRFSHAKVSIWLDTLPKILDTFADPSLYTLNQTDHYVQFTNGSEIWVAGLDDKVRTEKILGKEYSTIFFNECSQIPRESVDVALTRLAQKNDLVNKAYFDENPPSKKHWNYILFILKKTQKRI